MQKTTKTLLAAGAIALLAVNLLSAAPKKKQTKAEKEASKQLEKQFKDYQVQKDSKKKTWDFGGMEVIVGDWWSAQNGLQGEESHSPAEEATKKFRQFIMNTYNCNIDQYGIGGWGAHPQTVANFCTTGGDENYVFVIDGRSISAGLKANLFYDLAKIECIDWSKPKWNAAVREKTTKGKSFYGCRPIDPEPKGGVFFNKRLLKEAGIDPETIYDMQAKGTWTWETFEEMLKATTRDIDNDGVIDTYGMVNFSSVICPLAVLSNGSCFIDKDPATGKFFSRVGDDKTIEALTWIAKIQQLYEKPQPEGANWDWMYPAFINGEAAFQADEEYRVGSLADMKDDWGFVCFPLGPHGNGKYQSWHNDNTYVIPACYSKDRAEKIAKIFDLWSDPTPGYETAWKEDYYARFRDSRAVDETLQYMHDNGVPLYDPLISGLNLGEVIWGVYGGWVTPQEAYENTKNSYQALIDEQNR